MGHCATKPEIISTPGDSSSDGFRVSYVAGVIVGAGAFTYFAYKCYRKFSCTPGSKDGKFSCTPVSKEPSPTSQKDVRPVRPIKEEREIPISNEHADELRRLRPKL